MQLPTWRMVKKVSSSVGLGGSEAGNSPTPNSETCANCPGRKRLNSACAAGILEAPVKRLHLRDVVHHPVQDRQLRQIDIFSGWTGSCLVTQFSGAARRIISTTLGMPMSPWQTAAQRPQPTQAMDSSRWMK